MQDTYINPFTDFGFKKLFGEEPNKELLISLLNTLLPDHHQIEDLEYTRNEQQGSSQLDRKAIFDLSCTSPTGERFIVELQKAKQNYFKDRSVYYATFPVQEQAKRGDWDFKLSAVYTVGILDFTFEEDRQENNKEVLHTVQLKNQHGDVFYDKLTFIYLTLPNFTKQADELHTMQDKWFYAFKHLHELDHIPAALQERVFKHLFKAAQIAQFEPKEREAYENSLKYYRDLKNVTDTAHEAGIEEGFEQGLERGREEGLEQGLEKGRQDVAKKMLQSGLSIEQIAELTGLTEPQVRTLT
jgi:predicted transposase/invertase (TIGR01784 family)